MHERLVEAFDDAPVGEQWRAFARAVIAEAEAVAGQSDETEHLVAGAAMLWAQQVQAEEIRAHKRAVWTVLEAKYGDTTTIRDPDDRVLRALLAALEPSGNRADAEDAADWVATVLTGF